MNYNNIFAFVRQQKAFTAFMTTLVVLGSVSAVFAARGAQAETVFLNVKYTLGDPKALAVTTHTIEFTNKNTLTANNPLTITYPGLVFGGVSSVKFNDVLMSASGAAWTSVESCAAGDKTFEASATSNSITIKPCVAVSAASAVKIVLSDKAVADRLSNPTVVAPQTVDVTIAHPDTKQSQKVKVMILPGNVLMTAAVDPIFTFSIASTTLGSVVNGANTTFATTDTAINFGTLVPNVPSIGSQKLTVSTNAINGFNVTAQTDSDFKSENGATIDPFNLSASNTPIAWAAPAADLANDKTWGHIGLTTSDTSNTISGIASNQWVGNFINNPIVVLSNSSSTRNASTTVGYQVQISDLQEAATDYKTNVIYVATPQF